MRSVHTIARALPAFLLISSAALAVGEVDQQCTTRKGIRQIKAYDPMGQEFKPAKTTHVAVDLYLTPINPWRPDLPVTITILEDTITGPLVPGTQTTLAVQPGWNRFMFAAPVDLVPEAVYVIRAYAGEPEPPEDWSAHWGWAYDTPDAYARGRAILDGNPSNLSDQDFRTIVIDYVDQKCETSTGDQQIAVDQNVQQEFRPDEVEHWGVELYISSSGLPVEPITVRIREQSFDGEIVAEATEMPNFDGWHRFEFSTVDLVVDDLYFLEAATDDLAWQWTWNSDDDCYPDGVRWVGGNSQTGDQTFRTLVNPALPPVPAPCLGDLDYSGDVGFNDLVTLLAAWDTIIEEIDAEFRESVSPDLDYSGVVGFNDLVILLAGWGPCP